jgi:uncharacterized membrane protein YhaH (DUF805 family)
MEQLLRYLMALFTPWGRISQTAYGILALVIVGLHAGSAIMLANQPEGYPAYNPYSIAQFGLIWMMFCIISRRFHDYGETAFLLIPVMICIMAGHLSALDHAKLLESPFEEDRDQAQLYDRIRLVLQIFGIIVAVIAMRNPGDDGTNAFGKPFDNTAKKARMARTAAVAPRNLQSALARGSMRDAEHDEAQASAPQEHRTPRRRPQGFAGDRRVTTPHEFRRKPGKTS